MKNLNIYYWVSTILLAAFMGLGSISNVIKSPEAVQMISGLGYPEYIIPFLGIAKILGSIAILIPQFKRIKEWAYAGLFFDLLGAFYSIINKEGFQVQMIFMILPISILFLSYFLWHKKMDYV
jgi:uncharacterized membrane protein YphA (DoxX/SURF4 family)